MAPEMDLVLTLLDQAYDCKSWHGANLKGALRGLTAEAAARRPGPGRPSIHELVVHLAYWKYAVLRQLVDLPRGAFPLKGSNWFPRAKPRPLSGRAIWPCWTACTVSCGRPWRP